MTGTTAGFWCIFAVGILTGSILTGFLWVPFQHRRWERQLSRDQADIVRISGGLPDITSGRHAAVETTIEFALDDAAGAFEQAKIAPIPSPYPGPGRTPEPEWVRWVEEHGRLAIRPPKPPRWRRWLDQGNTAAFAVSFAALAILWVVGQQALHLVVAGRTLVGDIQAVFTRPPLDPPRVLTRKFQIGPYQPGLK